MKSTRTSSSSVESGSTNLTPIGNAFLYIETSQNSSGDANVFVNFETTVFFQISDICFYYSCFSSLTNDSSKSMGKFEVQSLINDDW